MQQLVALLATKDAQPDEHQQPLGGLTTSTAAVAAGTNCNSKAGPPAGQVSPTAAASQKLAAATSLSTILQAATEHLKAAKREFAGDGPARLDIGMIAKVKEELDVRQVKQLLWAFLVATQQVALAAGMLRVAAGQPELLVGGKTYPPAGAVVSARQLQPLVDEAWQLMGCVVAAEAQPTAS
eukprot:gene1501-1839_t